MTKCEENVVSIIRYQKRKNCSSSLRLSLTSLLIPFTMVGCFWIPHSYLHMQVTNTVIIWEWVIKTWQILFFFSINNFVYVTGAGATGLSVAAAYWSSFSNLKPCIGDIWNYGLCSSYCRRFVLRQDPKCFVSSMKEKLLSMGACP